MGVSEITVSGLTATNDVKGIKLSWIVTDPFSVERSVSLGICELWEATANDRAHGSFAKVGEGRNDYLRAGLGRGDVRYYWVRPRDKYTAANGGPNYGNWHPSSATAGVVGTEVSGDVLIAANGYWKHPSGLIEQWGATGIDCAVALGAVNVPFPIAFPTQCFGVHLQPAIASSTETKVAVLETIYLDSFDAIVHVVADGGSVSYTQATIHWRAIGY